MEKNPLTPDEVKDLKKEAMSRRPLILDQLDNLAAELTWRSPIRVARFRRDLEWITKEAEKEGVQWS